MNGDGYTRGIAGFGVDVMTPGYALQLPAVLFEQPSKIFSGDGFQTAMSKTLSLGEI
jgi:hypothetical protein